VNVVEMFHKENAASYQTKPTITLYTVAEGAAYAPFAERWLDSVKAMNPLPDEIVIVIGPDDHCQIRNRDMAGLNTRIIQLDEPFSNAYFRAGAENATSEWVAFCGLDDQMLPHAYKDLAHANAINANIMVGTIYLSNGTLWRGTWNPSALRNHNTLPAHSPIKKSLYQRVGGFPDIHWSDWGFWLLAAANGAKPFHSPEPLAIFDIGENRETMSGVSLSDQIRLAADNELKTFMDSL
jgi:hypothetical protein